MIHVLLPQKSPLVVEVLEDDEHLELSFVEADLARLVEIEQALSVLHVVIAVVEQLV